MKLLRHSGQLLAGVTLSAFISISAASADDASCRTIKMFDPGWTDINSTNGIAKVLLEGLGYEANIDFVSVPIGFQTIKNGGIDVFLGNWMPAQQEYLKNLQDADAVEIITTNLEGAKYTLAVPDYVASQGVTSVADLAKLGKEFDHKIYGIDPGSPGNANIQKVIDNEAFGLKGWSVIESGEQAMLAQVERYTKKKTPVVFLAWAPHPMNEKFPITYLSGADAEFGPDFGGANINTIARKGWTEKCPNAAKFFTNLKFDLPIENVLMGMITDDNMHPNIAAKQWLRKNPEQIEIWLDGIETIDGKNGLDAVKQALNL